MTNNRPPLANNLAAAAATIAGQQQAHNGAAAVGFSLFANPGGHNSSTSNGSASGTSGATSAANPSPKLHQQFLPSTAPVSSLLPPIPPSQPMAQPQQQHLMTAPTAAFQAQLAAALLATQGLAPQQQAQPNAAAMNFLREQQQQHQQPAAPSSLPLVSGAGATTAAVDPASSSLLSNMEDWPVNQLEQHVNLLQQLNQPVPHSTVMILNEAKRKADKKHAKRLANRKSACTSRARKKALVKEMTEVNARLRRQALILALLPDLVIVTDVEGKITFCSQQVENVLRHSIDDLVGAQLTEIIVPSSRDRFRNLIQELLSAQNRLAAGQDGKQELGAKNSKKEEEQDASKQVPKAKKVKLCSPEESNAVTDSSFPLSVVQVDPTAPTPSSSDENDNSDGSNSKQPSSLTTSSLGNSGCDDNIPKKDDRAAAKVTKKAAVKKKESSSDSSNTSSAESADVNNLLNANANLERNVRCYNMKMKDKAAQERASGYKDDVLGATVTANNASARLSSLQHLAESSSEEDSGYRESNDSRVDTSSSEGENSSESNGRGKPIAPTCNVCLIRDDLTTIWCEVTSSIRSRETTDETEESVSTESAKGSKKQPSSSSKSTKKRDRDDTISSILKNELDGDVSNHGKEIFLCLRPIRDGDEKTDEALRFKPASRKEGNRVISEDNKSALSSEDTAVSQVQATLKRPSSSKTESVAKKSRVSNEDDTSSKEIDTAMVESLMAIYNQK